MWRKLLIKKMRPFKTFSYKKIANKLFLKTLKKLLKKFKNIRRFDALGRHYQVKKNTVRNAIHQRTEA